MSRVFAIVAFSLVSLQFCLTLQIHHIHSSMTTGFSVGGQRLPFAVWNTPTSARTSRHCIHSPLGHMTAGSFESTHRIRHHLLIPRLKSRIVSIANQRNNQLPLHSLFENPTKNTAPRLAVAALALLAFLLCITPKSAVAADVLASPCQQLLAGGVSATLAGGVSSTQWTPLRYFSNFLPAGWSACPQQ